MIYEPGNEPQDKGMKLFSRKIMRLIPILKTNCFHKRDRSGKKLSV